VARPEACDRWPRDSRRRLRAVRLNASPLQGGAARPRKELKFEVSEVKLKKGEPVDRALRRLKKKVDRENTLRDVRMKRHYEKPSETKRRKMKVSKFSAMLAARYADQ
jgi:small subunit ribosomal protein S21